MNIIGLIPARGGSKGIKGKNLVLLNNRSLIDYTLTAAQKSALIQKIAVSTDDPGISAHCSSFNVDYSIQRPVELAHDTALMLPVIEHALHFLHVKGENPDIIVLLQPTSPLRTSRHIDEAVSLLINSDADSVVSVVECPHNFTPNSLMVLEGEYIKHYSSSAEQYTIRQNKPHFFGRNGPAVFAFRTTTVEKKKSLYGDKILPYRMSRAESIDIDEPFDLVLAEHLLKGFSS